MFFSHCEANTYPLITKNNYLLTNNLNLFNISFSNHFTKSLFMLYFYMFSILFHAFPYFILFFFHKFNRDLNFKSFFSQILFHIFVQGLKYQFQRIYRYLEFTDISKISEIHRIYRRYIEYIGFIYR